MIRHNSFLESGMRTILLTLVCLLFFRCGSDDEISAKIEGKWNGDRVNFKFNPTGFLPRIPLGNQTLAVDLIFNAGGKLTIIDSSQNETSGTYTLNGNSLRIDVDYTIESFELSGNYDVKQLTTTNLELEIKRRQKFEDPDSEKTYDGEITATFYFTREGD
jgi:hypothetical protein